jgi:hypothetical protein
MNVAKDFLEDTMLHTDIFEVIEILDQWKMLALLNWSLNAKKKRYNDEFPFFRKKILNPVMLLFFVLAGQSLCPAHLHVIPLESVLNKKNYYSRKDKFNELLSFPLF